MKNAFKNAYLDAKIGFDPAENEPPKVLHLKDRRAKVRLAEVRAIRPRKRLPVRRVVEAPELRALELQHEDLAGRASLAQERCGASLFIYSARRVERCTPKKPSPVKSVAANSDGSFQNAPTLEVRHKEYASRHVQGAKESFRPPSVVQEDHMLVH